MSRLRLLLVSSLTLALVPVGTFAASGDTTTGSGSTLVELTSRLAPYAADSAPTAEGLISAIHQAALDKLADRRLDARATCRTRLRKASASTRFGILSDCVIDDLLSQQAALDELADAIGSTPSVTDTARTATIQAVAAERDAIDTLVDGIESRVYGVETDLQKARQRLVQKYSTPRWLALTRLRADRGLHWIAWLAGGLQETATGSGAALTTTDDTTIACLLTTTKLLIAATTEADLTTAHQQLDDGLSQLASCAP